jgi:hypothetical protein
VTAARGGGAALVAGLVMLTGCSSGGGGLGRKACPYVRPRVIRVDTDRLRLATAPGPSLADLSAVAQDIAGYVRTNLPDHGKGKADQPLVAFSSALTTFVADHGSSGAALDGAERRLDRECHVSGY